MLKAHDKNTADRKPVKMLAPIRIVSATVLGQALTVTFDQAVQLTGLPGWGIDILGPVVVDAQRTQPNVIVLTFSNAITGAAQVAIPYQDPAIRNQFGGYVADTLYLLA